MEEDPTVLLTETEEIKIIIVRTIVIMIPAEVMYMKMAQNSQTFILFNLHQTKKIDKHFTFENYVCTIKPTNNNIVHLCVCSVNKK